MKELSLKVKGRLRGSGSVIHVHGHDLPIDDMVYVVAVQIGRASCRERV